MRAITIAAASVATALGVAGLAGAGSAPFATETFVSNFQQTATTNGPVQTNSKQFKRIRGAAPTLPGAEPNGLEWQDSVTVTVMVVLKSGKGTLRVVDGPNEFPDPEDGDLMYPRSVPIAGKGPHTVQFILDEGQVDVHPPEVQWKRRGNQRVRARTVVTSIQGEID